MQCTWSSGATGGLGASQRDLLPEGVTWAGQRAGQFETNSPNVQTDIDAHFHLVCSNQRTKLKQIRPEWSLYAATGDLVGANGRARRERKVSSRRRTRLTATYDTLNSSPGKRCFTASRMASIADQAAATKSLARCASVISRHQ